MKKFDEQVERVAKQENLEKLVNNIDQDVVGSAYEDLTIGEMLDIAGGNGDVDAEATPLVATITLAIGGAATGWAASAAAGCHLNKK